MPELPNFGHMTTPTIQFYSTDKCCWWGYRQIVTSEPLFSNTVTERSSGEANFVDINKITIMLIKAVFENSLGIKRNANYVLKWNFIPIPGYNESY